MIKYAIKKDGKYLTNTRRREFFTLDEAVLFEDRAEAESYCCYSFGHVVRIELKESV